MVLVLMMMVMMMAVLRCYASALAEGGGGKRQTRPDIVVGCAAGVELGPDARHAFLEEGGGSTVFDEGGGPALADGGSGTRDISGRSRGGIAISAPERAPREVEAELGDDNVRGRAGAARVGLG